MLASSAPLSHFFACNAYERGDVRPFDGVLGGFGTAGESAEDDAVDKEAKGTVVTEVSVVGVAGSEVAGVTLAGVEPELRLACSARK